MKCSRHELATAFYHTKRKSNTDQAPRIVDFSLVVQQTEQKRLIERVREIKVPNDFSIVAQRTGQKRLFERVWESIVLKIHPGVSTTGLLNPNNQEAYNFQKSREDQNQRQRLT